MSKAQFLIVADPGSKRWCFYEQAMEQWSTTSKWQTRYALLDWRDVLENRGQLDVLWQQMSLENKFDDGPVVLRIESPARDFEVMRKLLVAGAQANGQQNTEELSDVRHQKGKLISPGLVHAGLQATLHAMEESARRIPRLFIPSSPKSQAAMFDKAQVAHQLRAANIATPDFLTEPASHSSDLLEQLQYEHMLPAYVKLAFGSSASGIVRVCDTPQGYVGTSTTIHLEDGFYNTRRLQQIRHAKLAQTLDFILSEGAFVQRGVRMAQIDGYNFDVRVIVIRGTPEFSVFRLSASPMTNLHLGGHRGNYEHCKSIIPKRSWLDAMDDCVRAAKLYDVEMVGIDVIFDRNYMAHYILELNAFGDFIPGYTNPSGKTVHQVEIERLTRYFE